MFKTPELPKKIRSADTNPVTIWLRIWAWCVGGVAALLIARVVVRLFALRPAHPSFDLLLHITAPVRAPLAWLDAAQPQFGAVLEISTLVALLIWLIGGYLGWVALRAATVRQR